MPENKTSKATAAFMILIVSVVIGLTCGCEPSTESYRRLPCDEVIAQCRTANSECGMEYGPDNLLVYISIIRTIDASSCPKEFQLVWLAYLQSCDDYARVLSSPYPSPYQINRCIKEVNDMANALEAAAIIYR